MAIQRATENTVREAPATQARLQASDFGQEAYGRALEGFGKQLGSAVEEADKVVYKYDLAAAKNADTQDATELARIRAEALNSVGTEAETATEQARKEAEELKRRRLETLKGRRGELYSTAFDERLVGFNSQLSEHSIKQADVAVRGAAAARSDQSIGLAVAQFDDPKTFASNMATGLEEYRAANHGMSEDQIKLGWQEKTSRAHVAIIGNILATDPMHPHRAIDWYDDHKSEFTPDQASTVLARLAPQIAQEDVDTAAGRVMTEGATLASGGAVNYGNPVPKDSIIPPPKGSTPSPGEAESLIGPEVGPKPTPDGVNPNAPATSAVAPGAPKAPPAAPTKLYNNSSEVFSAVLGGAKYTLTNTAAQHEARGSGKAVDLAAPLGTRVHPPVSGTVVRAWYDQDHGGGWSVVIQHDNGTSTGYAHLQGKPPVENGQHVEKGTTIGAVGATGTKAHGVHLHFTVRDTKSDVRIDPQTMTWSAQADSGGPTTVDPGTVPWKEGGIVRIAEGTAGKDTLTKYIHTLNLVAAERERQGHGFSQTEYDALAENFRHQAARNDQMYTAAYNQMWDGVQKDVAAMNEGSGLVSINQIPHWADLNGGDRLQLQNLIHQNIKAAESGEDVKTGGDRFLKIYAMQYDTTPRAEYGGKTGREVFMGMDMLTLSGVAKSERTELFKRKEDMINDTTGKLTASNDKIKTVVDLYTNYASSALKDPNSKAFKEHDQLIYEVGRVVNARQTALGRDLSDDELRDIARSAITTVTRGGEKMPLAIARTEAAKPGTSAWVNYDDVVKGIPKQSRDQITGQLQSHGIPPTNKNIAQAWLELSR